MSRKSWRTDRTTTVANPQKYKWSQKKSFTNFEEADAFRNQLTEEGFTVKVKRHGPAGSQFKVVVGTEIKKNTKNKKEKVNASE